MGSDTLVLYTICHIIILHTAEIPYYITHYISASLHHTLLNCSTLLCNILHHTVLNRWVFAVSRVAGWADATHLVGKEGGQEDRRTEGQEDRRTWGQEGRKTGGQEDRRQGDRGTVLLKRFQPRLVVSKLFSPDNLVFYQDRSSEHSQANWERGEIGVSSTQ